MQTTQYEIPAENLPRFQERFNAIARKAVKLGFEVPTYTIGEAYEKLVDRKEQTEGYDVFNCEDAQFDHWEEYVTFHSVTVSGQSPKFEGWSFAAVCDYADEPVIIRALSDVTLPAQYRDLGPACEHCKLDRKRSECCILSHEDGGFIQVGKSCLKDFLGHKSPERMAEMAEILRDLADDCRGFAGERVNTDPSLVTVLTWTSSVISRLGWCPKSKEDLDDPNGRTATATIVSRYMGEYAKCLEKREKFPYPLPTKGDFDRATLAVAYAQNLSGTSDYELNVRAVARRSGVSTRNFGIACSIMGAYDRETAKKSERTTSEFVGTIGRKVNCTCVKKTCKCAPIKVMIARVITLPDYGFGASYVNIMRDVAGNTLVWKTSTCLATGADYMLSGSVKEHDDSKYGKQTILTRCKVDRVDVEIDETIAA